MSSDGNQNVLSRRSSVVERPLGKREAESSILSGGTIPETDRALHELVSRGLVRSLMQRFTAYVDGWDGDASQCWNWIGGKNSRGYGRFKIGGNVSCAAHRVSFSVANGYVPIGRVVCHSCDNPSCVNPAHLWAGAHRDNSHDMVTKGRHKNGDLRGEKNPRAKLSADQVSVIKQRIARGETNTSIAQDYGVSHALISCIKRGRAWGG